MLGKRVLSSAQYSYLLTSQLESQRIYWENKIVHLEKDTAEEVRIAQT